MEAERERKMTQRAKRVMGAFSLSIFFYRIVSLNSRYIMEDSNQSKRRQTGVCTDLQGLFLTSPLTRGCHRGWHRTASEVAKQ